jgi:hypothetical protein
MRENEPNCVRRLHAASVLLRNRRPINEVFCLAEALDECVVALAQIGDVRTFDAGVDHAVATIRDAIDCSDVVVWDQRGRSYARAEHLSAIERAAFEDAVQKLLTFLRSRAGMRFLDLAAKELRQEGAA